MIEHRGLPFTGTCREPCCEPRAAAGVWLLLGSLLAGLAPAHPSTSPAPLPLPARAPQLEAQSHRLVHNKPMDSGGLPLGVHCVGSGRSSVQTHCESSHPKPDASTSAMKKDYTFLGCLTLHRDVDLFQPCPSGIVVTRNLVVRSDRKHAPSELWLFARPPPLPSARTVRTPCRSPSLPGRRTVRWENRPRPLCNVRLPSSNPRARTSL